MLRPGGDDGFIFAALVVILPIIRVEPWRSEWT